MKVQDLKDKEGARRRVMADMKAAKVFRFPFLPSRRIPNFKGSDQASMVLFEFPEIASAKVVKCNPDSPQRLFREEALRRGKILLVPTPRLIDDFLVLDPAQIPAESYERASRSSGFAEFGTYCRLRDIPQPDVTVVGSVAVGKRGGRCGKGHGYADLESAMLREVGLDSTPVFSTVHPIQLSYEFPTASSDLVLCGVATPRDAIRFRTEAPPWPNIDWDLLQPRQIEEIPLLQELQSGGDKREKGGSKQ